MKKITLKTLPSENITKRKYRKNKEIECEHKGKD